MAELPWLISPHEQMHGVLDQWQSEIRGAEASQDELRAFTRFLVTDEPMTGDGDRQVQVSVQWLDRILGAPRARPAKILRRSPEQVRTDRLERLVEQLGLSFDTDEREWSIFDLWIEAECLGELMGTSHGMVDRWKELRVVLVDESFSKRTYEYLEEAARSHLLGQFRACIALCRATTESSLKDRLPGIEAGSDIELVELISLAKRQKVLNGKHERFAHKIRVKGNDVMHLRGGTVSQQQSKEVLRLTGELVEALFK